MDRKSPIEFNIENTPDKISVCRDPKIGMVVEPAKLTIAKI